MSAPKKRTGRWLPLKIASSTCTGLVAVAAGLAGSPAVPDATPIPLFPSAFRGAVATAKTRDFVGIWTAGRVRLAIIPRRCPEGAEDCLYGAIPAGPHEGALMLRPSQSQRTVAGALIRAAPTLERIGVDATLTPSGLELRIAGSPVLVLRRAAGVNEHAMAKVAIIGHRGLGLGSHALENTARAIEHASWFGASGVEVDVVVPYAAESGVRRPVVSDLRVHHPPDLRAEVTGLDSSPLPDVRAAPTPAEALALASAHHISFVYLDPKLRWLQGNDGAMRDALSSLVQMAHRAISRDPALQVVIGAETNRAAEMLAQMSWPAAEGKLRWAQEFTRGTDIEAALRRAAVSGHGRPDVLSLNLLGIRGGGGGLLRWFVGDLDRFEKRLSGFPQTVFFWTADSDNEFAGALEAWRRLSPQADSRGAAIMTPRSHRLAYYLASDRTIR